jgi:hypothetical protein
MSTATQPRRDWTIQVCRTCDRLAMWPFCEHRDERRPADAPSWCVSIDVIPASRAAR